MADMYKATLTAIAAATFAAGATAGQTLSDLSGTCESPDTNVCPVKTPDSHHIESENSREVPERPADTAFLGGVVGRAAIVEGADQLSSA